MFRFSRRELVLIGITALVTAGGMYAAWQADRAVLALKLSHEHALTHLAELDRDEAQEDARAMARLSGGRYGMKNADLNRLQRKYGVDPDAPVELVPESN
jgi:hypothetical protein